MIEFIKLVMYFVTVGIAVVGFIHWRGMRDVVDTPLVPIAEAKPGMEARFQGRAAFAGETRRSLLGDEPAVWYRWSVERYEPRSERTAGGWSPLADGASTEPLAIVDEAGNRILVFPRDVEVRSIDTRTWDTSLLEKMSETARGTILQGAGMLSVDAGRSELRFHERWLRPGVMCFVVGRIEAPGPEHGAGLGPDVLGCITQGVNQAVVVELSFPAQEAPGLRRKLIIDTGFFALALVVVIALSFLD